jgi:predicted metal-dependent HD superfamily phosphohydrolase
LRKFSTPFIEEVKEYVADFIADHFSEEICYHNIDHTLEVVEASEIIGRKCDISEKEMEIVIVAAWFHDTGYYLGCENHEASSAQIAEEYLENNDREETFIKAVKGCILATKIPQKPRNLLEKIVCDADLYHLATEKFFEKSELLWREFSFTNQDMTPEGWLYQSKEFVESHQYHTRFGKEKLYPQLKKNLKQLTKKIDANDY